jgi:hypothetical protein
MRRLLLEFIGRDDDRFTGGASTNRSGGGAEDTDMGGMSMSMDMGSRFGAGKSDESASPVEIRAWFTKAKAVQHLLSARKNSCIGFC